MIKEYICKREKISEALNEIDSFITLLTNFNIKHNSNYNYNINIKKEENEIKKWLIELKVNNNEK